MDTNTHILSGVGIACIAAEVSPEISHVTLPLLLFTIITSNSPDFDVITKVFGNLKYIKNHRGFTHAISFWPVHVLGWSFLFSLLTSFSFGLLATIALICVSFHILLDVLNSYGTKILPKHKWIRLSIVHTIDPVITSILVVCSVLSIPQFKVIDNTSIFVYGFLAIAVYLLIRMFIRFKIVLRVKQLYPEAIKYDIKATSKPHKWYVAVELENEYQTFRLVHKEQIRLQTVEKQVVDEKYIKMIEHNDIYVLFRNFSPLHAMTFNGEELRITDLRYRKNSYFYFNANFMFKDDTFKKAYIGWVLSENKRKKKIALED